MKKILLTLLLLVCLPVVLFAGGDASDDAADSADVLKDAYGTITKVGNFGYGIVPDTDPGTRYAPVEPLAEEFQEDGLRVVFSGKVGSADENAGRGRRWGTPLEVTAIERLAESDDP